jgi:hypothetical protein
MHERTITVGDTQSFIFEAEHAGPFWMTKEERETNRHDRILPLCLEIREKETKQSLN